ncbi:unnamed protein product [Cyclocybe aegerita]|uniref:Uncharacterized protein n=1 Tax=Cyclocybe aegerita TaxID=1973307 RepID=A0A8S0XR63_CYCAE|nr:unnamed protein product [Cyclocybe aegerita]
MPGCRLVAYIRPTFFQATSQPPRDKAADFQHLFNSGLCLLYDLPQLEKLLEKLCFNVFHLLRLHTSVAFDTGLQEVEEETRTLGLPVISRLPHCTSALNLLVYFMVALVYMSPMRIRAGSVHRQLRAHAPAYAASYEESKQQFIF